MPDSVDTFDLPGFRFHPTEEELLDFYLKNVVSGRKLGSDIIGFVSIYKYDPWELPGLAKVGEREWYFFVPRDWKHGSGGRPNRTTENGFWKATGSDRKIVSLSEPKRFLGMRKTLVFYSGRAPKGCRTDWVMNEYRLPVAMSCVKNRGIERPRMSDVVWGLEFALTLQENAEQDPEDRGDTISNDNKKSVPMRSVEVLEGDGVDKLFTSSEESTTVSRSTVSAGGEMFAPKDIGGVWPEDVFSETINQQEGR